MTRALAIALFALGSLACTYDTSQVARADAAVSASCNAVSMTGCGGMEVCSTYLRIGARLMAACGPRGTRAADVPCDGPGLCAPGMMCVATTASDGTCEPICTTLEPTCALGRTCDMSAPLVEEGRLVAYRCVR